MSTRNIWIKSLILALFIGFSLPSVTEASFTKASCEMTKDYAEPDYAPAERDRGESKSGWDGSECQTNCFSSFQSMSDSPDIGEHQIFSLGKITKNHSLPDCFNSSTPERPPKSS